MTRLLRTRTHFNLLAHWDLTGPGPFVVSPIWAALAPESVICYTLPTLPRQRQQNTDLFCLFKGYILEMFPHFLSLSKSQVHGSQDLKFLLSAISTSFLWYFPPSTGITMRWCGTETGENSFKQDKALKIKQELENLSLNFWPKWQTDTDFDYLSLIVSTWWSHGYLGHEWSLFTCPMSAHE